MHIPMCMYILEARSAIFIDLLEVSAVGTYFVENNIVMCRIIFFSQAASLATPPFKLFQVELQSRNQFHYHPPWL